MTSATTQAADWFAAKARGQRLPAHTLPEDAICDLCSEPMRPDPETEAATGFNVCTACVEASL